MPSRLAYARQNLTGDLPLLERASQLLPTVASATLTWAQSLSPVRLPSLDEFRKWEASFYTLGHGGNFVESLRVYLLMHPGMRLLEPQQRSALTDAFWPFCLKLLAAVAASPDPVSHRSWLECVRDVLSRYIENCRGGWYTAVPPDHHMNMWTAFHSLLIVLSYHPRYGATTVSPPDRPPCPASMEHPEDREAWLWSVQIVNVLLTAIQRELGDPVGRMASRLTPSDMPGSRGHDVCAQLLQALFTDLAVHNDATQPYNCTMGGDAVSLAGRLPYFPRALKHHAELREAQAELADKPFLVSIYMGGRAVEFWDRYDGIEITPVVAALTHGMLQRAGHEPPPSTHWGGLQRGGAFLKRRGRIGMEMVFTAMHACADQAHASALGQPGRGMLPFGTLQAIAAAAAVILGPGLRFPSPELMPTYFSHGTIDAVRQNCLGCRFYINVQREGGYLMQECPCLGQCTVAGLYGLSITQRHRLQHACEAGHFTTTELDFVLWTGKLPDGVGSSLVGLHGGARDTQLRALMDLYDVVRAAAAGV